MSEWIFPRSKSVWKQCSFLQGIKTKALLSDSLINSLYWHKHHESHRSKAGNIYKYLPNIYLPDTPSSWHRSGILPPCLALRAGCSCLKENIIWVTCPLHVARAARVSPDWGVAVGSLNNLHDSSKNIKILNDVPKSFVVLSTYLLVSVVATWSTILATLLPLVLLWLWPGMYTLRRDTHSLKYFLC